MRRKYFAHKPSVVFLFLSFNSITVSQFQRLIIINWYDIEINLTLRQLEQL